MCDDLLGEGLFDGGGLGRRLLAVGMAGLLCLAASAGQEGWAQSLSEPAAPPVGAERAEPGRVHARGAASQVPSSQAPSSQALRRATPGDVPSWAEPRADSSPPSEGPSWNAPRGERRVGKRRAGEHVQTNAPGGGTPGGGDKVPLGGLEWLLAAGAGYGFWKLRGEEE